MNESSTMPARAGMPWPLQIALLLLGPATFLTGVGLVPGVANNIGPFELVAALIIGFTMLHGLRNNWIVEGHFVTRVLALITLLAGVNLLKLSDRLSLGITQWLLLFYALCLLLVFYNLIRQFPSIIPFLLRILAFSAVAAAVLVIADGFSTEYIYDASGPFRNRVHVGIYMMSSFWLLLIYMNLPHVGWRERALLLAALPLIIYAISISGRRSVYIAFAAGIAFTFASALVLFRKNRGRTLLVLFMGVGFLLLLYVGRDLPFLPDTTFFQERVLSIEDRLRAFAGDEEIYADDENFILLQRRGMVAALQDYPLLGIGWGAFYESQYSPTGHEMHSTPQRFLAELGLLGFGLYLLLSGYLLLGSLRLVWEARDTPYHVSTIMLFIAFCSLHISWFYNRSITDRSYWLLIIFLMGFELLVQREKLKSSAETRHSERTPVVGPIPALSILHHEPTD